MSNYRRLISYIYAYEGGVKGKNIGFAKIETRGTQCKITVSVKKVYVGGNDIGVYLLAPDAEIYLGNIFIRGGSGEFRTVVTVSDVEHSGMEVEQCYGLTVHDVKNTWRSYTTIWEDAVAHAAEVDLVGAALKPAKPGALSMSEAMIKRAVKEIEEEFPLPALKPEESAGIREKEGGENEEIDFSQYIQADTGWEEMQEAREQTFASRQSSIEKQAPGEQWKEPEYVEEETKKERREQQTEKQQEMAEQQIKEEAVEAVGDQKRQGSIETTEQKVKQGTAEASEQQARQNNIETPDPLAEQISAEEVKQQAKATTIEAAKQQAEEGPIKSWEQQTQEETTELSGQQKAGRLVEPPVPEQNSALRGEVPIPERTICYRADAVLQGERNSGDPETSQADFGEMTSAQPSRQKAFPGESSRKDSAIKLTDPKELERLSQLEEEEEASHDLVWERLKREHTRILAFDYEKGCEILTIKPQDIGLLPREEWVYGNNSFLLHGYYNYRYLILARLHNPEGTPRYLLGVPGHYYSNERYMASMFGFPSFVLSKEQPVGDGRFGYWYTDVLLGD